MPTIEVVVFPLAEGADIGDPDSNAAKVLSENIDLIKQQPGAQGVHFGLQIENSSLLQLFISTSTASILRAAFTDHLKVWESIDAHKKFQGSESYGPFQKKFGQILASKPTIVHVDFEPYSSVATALGAPCTEVASFYFNGTPPKSYVSDALKIEPVLKQHAAGYIGGALGVSYEELERDGVKGQVGVLVLGWESKAKHMEFRETSAFRENIGMLRGESKGIEMHHVQFMEAV
ncbi:hypothetical protein B0A48_12763 [Cryoendolithus antarcticus]|uniref:ABM domain-containing protein n=1 Tax=Cryoendolithus antarcticus TaxID=1507870 RepID=A0A1V8SRE0_9PEZI|nr:hypothetical protein B0A48_12763 [Cryoendolithus antarcticus]